MIHKLCSKCHASSPVDSFYRGKQWKDGFHPWCKTCFNQACKIRYHNNGIPRHHKWNRDLVRHSYFEHVSEPLQAYILGFIAADGYIKSNVPSVGIELSMKDISLLEMIRDELAPAHTLHTRKKKSPTSSNISEMVTFVFTSPKMVSDLAKFSVVPRKSFIVRLPSVLCDSLKPYFILGYFDGDGNITEARVGGRTYPVWQITSGSIDLLRDVISFVKKQKNVIIGGPYPKSNKKSNKCYYIRVTGKKAIILDEWLHESNMGLCRKKIT